MDEIQSKLQNVYKRYGIDYKVKKNTIEDYYDVSLSYSKKPYTYTLKAIKEFSSKQPTKSIVNELLEGVSVDDIDF